MEPFIVTGVFGLLLGAVWRGRLETLLTTTLVITFAAGLLVGKWQPLRIVFANIGTFLYFSASALGAFMLLIYPAIAGALIAFFIKRSLAQKGGGRK